MKSYLQTLLSQSVDSAILGYFRIAFGLVMLIQFHSIQDYFIDDLSHRQFLFKYDGFEWIQLLTANQLQILFIFLKVFAICFMLGLFYRISSIVIFLGWTYLFLVDRGHYNNHYYFYSLILFLFTVVNANEFASLKSKAAQQHTIPYWQILVFQLQVFIVYFYGGIAKLDMDWLVGHPMINILPFQVQHLPDFLSSFFSSKIGAITFSYVGLIFDLCIGFMLFSKRLRYWALMPIIIFHMGNHLLWTIGTFPWAMLAATFIFFNPSWPRNLVDFFRQYLINNSETLVKPKHIFTNENVTNKQNDIAIRKQVLYLFCIYFLIQFLVPFRHILYKGDAAWTGQGHLFAWRMMLNNSDDAIRLKAKIPSVQKEFYVDLLAYMSRRQLNKITKTPKMMLKFAHYISDEIKQKGNVEEVFIHLEIYKSVNFRTPQLLNDTTLNYALLEYDVIKNASWILPYTRKLDELQVGINDKANWKGVLNE